ncbi:histidine kinase [Actinacidiphila soli]|uniref:hypothetical protein n=1 Tax=Actinacidiphila soli TaxID=2487275 RepID=UPI000FCCB085|nr:hypothetical protein [Actinacidiphila soli]
MLSVSRFLQVGRIGRQSRTGSGLGLAIGHDIVAAHHSSTHIEDNVPGARLDVSLPAANS